MREEISSISAAPKVPSQFLRQAPSVNVSASIHGPSKAETLTSIHTPLIFLLSRRSIHINSQLSSRSAPVACVMSAFIFNNQRCVNGESTRISWVRLRLFWFLLETHCRIVILVASREQFAEDVVACGGKQLLQSPCPSSGSVCGRGNLCVKESLRILRIQIVLQIIGYKGASFYILYW